MASTSFRDSMNSMGWSRRDPDIPANTNISTPILSRLQSLNPFGESGYVRLPTHNEGPGAPLPAPTRREEEEGWFARESYLQVYRPASATSALDDPSRCTAVFVTRIGLMHPSVKLSLTLQTLLSTVIQRSLLTPFLSQ